MSKLIEPPVMPFADFGRLFIVETEAFPKILGMVLLQKDMIGEIYPIKYASRTMTAGERK